MQVSGESRGLGPDGAPKELAPAPVLCQMLELSMAALHRVYFPLQHFDDGLDNSSLSLSSQLCTTLILGYGEILDTTRPLASYTVHHLFCCLVSRDPIAYIQRPNRLRSVLPLLLSSPATAAPDTQPRLFRTISSLLALSITSLVQVCSADQLGPFRTL